MRMRICFGPLQVVALCLLAGIAMFSHSVLTGHGSVPVQLTADEMRKGIGLQTADYECVSAGPGCCQGLACGSCPDCYQCTNDIGDNFTCQSSFGMSCTTLSDGDCGDLVQGECGYCEECSCGDPVCDMDSPTLLGSCGSIMRCQ